MSLVIDVPAAPGRPHAVSTSATSATIVWDEPDSDGGSPIIGYVLEMRLADSREWRVAHAAEHLASNRCEVTGLSANCDYLFRVCAVNKVGQSPYSPVSGAVRAAPHAEDLTALAPSISELPESVRVALHAGASASARCVAKGAAPLRVRAFRGDTELLSGGKYSLSLSESQVLIEIGAVSARDLGDYRVQVSNAFGTAFGSFRLEARGAYS